MSHIGFIGLGNMGGPMVRNLIRAGHSLKVFDLSEEAINFAVQLGAVATKSVKEAASGVEFVISMLPVGVNVKEVFWDRISSNYAVASELNLTTRYKIEPRLVFDAPVSGGTIGAEEASLAIMVGGDKNTFEKAKPILQCMGKNIIHCGNAGLGQVTKICNNMLAGINALAASEAMVMGERLGVSRQTLYDVISTSTGRSYIFENSNPMSGVCTNSPANNDFKPGFMAKLMLKDLRLSQAAAQSASTSTPLGAVATAAFQQLIENGHGDADTSSIIKVIDPKMK